MELSKRLMAVAGLVTEGASVADIGTDHGYIPIYLAEKGLSPRIIAMDVNSGPLKRAGEHIREYGFEDRIETRLSDGLNSLKPGEAETMIAAGMGGGLIIRILENSRKTAESIREFILQPQSDIHKVRAYLNRNHFRLLKEDMVEEEGKFYPVMKWIHGTEEEYSETELYYGRILLAERHPVLRKYLLREQSIKEKIGRELAGRQGDRITLRRRELDGELERIRLALSRYPAT